MSRSLDTTPPKDPAACRLRFLGDAVCECAGRAPVPLEDKDALLLACLALGGPVPRRALATMLWPEVEEARALANLRQRLFRLRRTLGFDPVEGAVTVGLRPGLAHDLDAADDGRAELLGAMEEPGAGSMWPWLAAARRQRWARWAGMLAADAERLASEGQLGLALAAVQRILRIEPTSEPAHRMAMRVHYLRGERAAALQAFDLCEQVLKDEVGTRPSAETLALLATIEQSQGQAWVRGQPLPAAVLLPPRIIGREAELQATAQAWTSGNIFVVTGEAGAGKSRLLSALFGSRNEVVVVRARPGDESVALATLLRLAQQLGERWPALRGSASYAQVARLAGGGDADPREGIRSVVPASTDLLRRAAACGLAGLVLDDLQFADDRSVEVWLDWFDRPVLAGLRFGFASRTAGAVASERLERLRARSDTVNVAVPPLGAAQTEALVASLGLGQTDVAAVAAALVARIGGNPLHLLETIRRALEQHGVLDADFLDAPAQVLDLLEQRLVALPAEALLLVRIAAVAGSDFSPGLAADVSRRDVLALADAWVALERQGILDERGFAHDLMMEAALRLLPGPIRRALFARVAAYCTQRGAPPARLAHHWLQAGDALAAMPHLVAAARLAWRTGRARETQEAFFQAADIELSHGRPDNAFDLLFECSEAMTRLDPGVSASRILPRLQPLARTGRQQARVALVDAGCLYFGGDVDAAHKGLLNAFHLAVTSGDKQVQAECMYWRAWGASVEGQLWDSVAGHAACAAMQRALGNERLALFADASRMRVLQQLGRAGDVRREQQDAWPWLQSNGDPVDLATFRIAELATLLDLGDVQAVDAGADAAWQAVIQADMRGRKLARSARTMLRVLRRRGKWDRALELVAQFELKLGGREGGSALAPERAALYLDLGRADLALPDIEELERSHRARHPGPHPAAWQTAGLRWRHQAATGAPALGLPVLQRALDSEFLPMACALLLSAAESGVEPLPRERLPALVQACSEAGLQRHVLPLQALQLWRDAAAGAIAADAADAALTLQAEILRTDLGAAFPACALWLSKAFRLRGDLALADACATDGARWVRGAQASVPHAFRESFGQDNPVHRALLAFA